MLKKNIADLVQDADPVRRTFLAIKDNLPLNLAEVLTPLSNIEDQAPRVKLYWPRRTPIDKRPKS